MVLNPTGSLLLVINRTAPHDVTMRRARAPPVALDASQCPGGRGVDFIADLPEVLTRRVLMSLPGKQLARCQAVSTAWRNICGDEPSWAKAYDDSYGSKPAEHLSLISIGIAPPMKRLVPFTDEELHPPGGGWRAAYARRFTASIAQRRQMASREDTYRARARGRGNGVTHGSAGDPHGLELSGASYFGGG